MSEAQRKAPEEQADRRQEAPRPQFSPPPVQQQDLRQVGAMTDQRVQQALDHGARLEGRLPNPDLEQRARNLTDWATQVRGMRIGDREYSAQADIIVQNANRALQSGDSALMDKALGQAMLLGIGVNAQWRGDTSGTPDGRAISESIQRGWAMFGTDQGTERLSYSVAGARALEDNSRAFSSPENQDAKNGILRAISRLTDPSVSMRPDEVRSTYQAIQQNAAVAAIRSGGNELVRDITAQLQIVLASDTAREKLKDQVDKLIDSLGSAMAKLSDSKKDKEEKDKAVSELGEKTEKLAAAALESALAEAGAPPGLIAALKSSGKMLDSKASAVRERGRQLLQLGVMYLRN